MERDGLVHVQVPVGPVVAAGELLVLVRDVQRLQVLVEVAVLVEQEVVGPAVDPERRDPAMVDPLDERERVLGPPRGDLPKIRANSGLRSRAVSGSSRGNPSAPECELTLANISDASAPSLTAP